MRIGIDDGETPLDAMHRREAERAMRPVADLLERVEPGTRRSIVELAILVRRQCLSQELPFGTVLRNRRTGREEIYVGSKPWGYEERLPSAWRGSRSEGRGRISMLREQSLVWTLNASERRPGVSQSLLSDWIVVSRPAAFDRAA